MNQDIELDSSENQALAEYLQNRYTGCIELTPNEEYLNGWKNIAALADYFGADRIINQKLCKDFPIRFKAPGQLKIELYESFAGVVPVIYAGDTEDFEELVTNIVYKGFRPDNIEKTGASFVSGKVTRFIILSSKPYSNVPAEELGLDDRLWQEKSLLIRRSHECTHFYTKQHYGMANNLLHDELMADLIGLWDSFGYYRAEWFLKFMGLIPGSGDRLKVYTKGLSQKAADKAAELAVQAAKGLEVWSKTETFLSMSNADRIRFMCQIGIEGMINLN